MLLRTAARLSNLASLGLSLALMFSAGRNQRSFLLMALFTLWVASPFVGLGLTDRFASRWPAAMRTLLYVLMMMVSAGSLAVYGNVIPMPAGTKNAAAYLLVPLVSWVLIVATLWSRVVRAEATLRLPSSPW